jgi:hypothetical protein
MTNTRDGFPGDALDALQAAWPSFPWHRLRTTHGAFHVVLVLEPEAVIRVRSGKGHIASTSHDVTTARVLDRSGLRVPQPLGEPVTEPTWSAAAYEYVPGTTLEPTTWRTDRRTILPLLESLVRTGEARPALRTELGPARQWCGGNEWRGIVGGITCERSYRASALARIDEMLAAEADAAHGVVHGDFGPHNILLGASVPRLIDPDNAAWADPAIDVAPLLAHYPADDLACDIGRSTLRRASLHRRTLPLQVAAAAELAGDAALRDHALGNFARRNQGQRPSTEPGIHGSGSSK